MYAIDPTPDELRDLLDRSVASVYRWPARFTQEFASATARPEGVLTGTVAWKGGTTGDGWEDTPSSKEVGVCWWTDRLGRKHWLLGLDGLAAAEPAPGVRLL